MVRIIELLHFSLVLLITLLVIMSYVSILAKVLWNGNVIRVSWGLISLKRSVVSS